MRVCECICRFQNRIGNIVAYDLRFRDGSIMPISDDDLVDALKHKQFRCTNMTLLPFGNRVITHLHNRDKVPIVSERLFPELTQEINVYVQAYYSRCKLSGLYANLELAFDNFLSKKRNQGTVFTPMTQYCIYEYMKNLVSWDICSAYIDSNGTIIFSHTNVTEGTFVLRSFVMAVCGRQNGSLSPFPANIGRLKVINQSAVTDMFSLFAGIKSGCLDLSEFTTKGVTRMGHMFCNSLIQELNLRSFDTSKVDDMQLMFAHNHALTKLDISSFDTRNVTYMGGMFQGCIALRNLDLGHISTSKVRWMNEMFAGCDVRTWNISQLDFSRVESMIELFSGGIVDTAQLRDFDTSKVEQFSEMFGYCGFDNGKCDISTWNIQAGTAFANMFYHADIEEVKLPVLASKHGFIAASMFANCERLRHLEIDFGFSGVEDFSQLCCLCYSLEVLTLKGLDFTKVKKCSDIIMQCPSLRVLNLECKGLDPAKASELLPKFSSLRAFEAINMRGSDNTSIMSMKHVLSACQLRVRVLY